MIDALVQAASRRVRQADAVRHTDDTITLERDADGIRSIARRSSVAVELRVFHEGRIGVAAAATDETPDLLARALADARSGEALEFALPAPADLPAVQSADARAQAAEAEDLARLTAALHERLATSGRQIETWAERSAGTVRVLNTRDAVAQYDATLVGIGARVRRVDSPAPPLDLHWSGVGLPSLEDLEGLAGEAEVRLAPALLEDAVLPQVAMVCLAPRALKTLLRPLRPALHAARLFGGAAGRGDLSPLASAAGDPEPRFDPALSLTDDPSVPGRPGTRPVDDEGVATRRLPLIREGRVTGWVADLGTGARVGVPATGHAWRARGMGTRVAFSNLRMAPGDHARKQLLGLSADGILVADLEPQGGNLVGGAFALRAPWAYRLGGGEVLGRLEGVVLTGNLWELLRRIAGIGRKPKWIGSAELPMVAIEGVGIRGER